MSTTLIFILLLSITVIKSAIDLYINRLNTNDLSKEVPDLLKDIYDETTYKKQQSYNKESNKLNLKSKYINFAFAVIILLFGVYGKLYDYLYLICEQNDTLTLLGILSLSMITGAIVELPFSYYDNFVIEEKYGFNKSTRKLFFIDAVKSLILGLILTSLMIGILSLSYEYYGINFIYISVACIAFVSLLIMCFYSSLIVPLFNKQTPLEDGELKTKIENLCSKLNFAIDNVYVIDGSKRTSKANAYFTGMGKTKRICLYDTLIETLTHDEILAVLLHEIGHYKHKHVYKSMFFSIINISITLYLLSLFINNQYLLSALGSNLTASFGLSIIGAGICVMPYSLIVDLFLNYISRKHEYEADSFVKQHNYGNSLISSLKKLSKDSLSNLTPNKWYVMFKYSHPTLLDRITNLNK